MAAWSETVESTRQSVLRLMTRHLTKPLRNYDVRIANHLPSLKQHMRPGDVLLVEGEQRVSQVIRYLTQSSWSHSALYVGDELRRFNPRLADELAARHGPEGKHLLVEATVEAGVSCVPLAKYTRNNIRVCRPRGLRRDDLDRILQEVTGQLGREYNVRHILELGRYFFPVSLIPRRYRRTALQLGGDATRQVICTTMLARAFARVGYPIVPRVTLNELPAVHGWLDRIVGRNGNRAQALFEPEDPTLITPRDFDLSPYFEIVKLNYLVNTKFDYRRIAWSGSADQSPSAASRVADLDAARDIRQARLRES